MDETLEHLSCEFYVIELMTNIGLLLSWTTGVADPVSRESQHSGVRRSLPEFEQPVELCNLTRPRLERGMIGITDMTYPFIQYPQMI